MTSFLTQCDEYLHINLKHYHFLQIDQSNNLSHKFPYYVWLFPSQESEIFSISSNRPEQQYVPQVFLTMFDKSLHRNMTYFGSLFQGLRNNMDDKFSCSVRRIPSQESEMFAFSISMPEQQFEWQVLLLSLTNPSIGIWNIFSSISRLEQQ